MSTMNVTETRTLDVETSLQATTEPRRSSRIRMSPHWFLDKVLLLDNAEPVSYTEAMICPNSVKWLNAMKSKIDSMHENQVWNLVDLPEGVNPVEYEWICKKKTYVDGNVYICKA